MTQIHILDKYNFDIKESLSNRQEQKLVLEDSHKRNIETHAETYDFTVDYRASEKFENMDRILIPDEEKNTFREFIINSVETDTFDGITEVLTEASYLEDLRKAKPIAPGKLDQYTPEDAVRYALRGTNWEIGEVDYAGFRTISWTSYNTPYELLKIFSTRYEAQLDFTIETTANKVSKRLVHLRQPKDLFSGKEIRRGKDLADLTRAVISTDVVTALVALGPEPQEEDAERLVIEIKDDVAQAKWGKAYNYIWGLYEPESSDENMTEARLKTLATTELNKHNKPKVEYTIEAVSIENQYPHEKVRIGDKVRIKDDVSEPYFYVDAVVKEIERSNFDPSVKKYVLGEITEYNRDDLREYFTSMLNTIRERLKNTNSNVKDIVTIIDTEVERRIYKQPTPPDNPIDDQLWLDTSNPDKPVLKRYYQGQWHIEIQAVTDPDDIGAISREEAMYESALNAFENIKSSHMQLIIQANSIRSNKYVNQTNLDNIDSKMQKVVDAFNNVTVFMDSVTDKKRVTIEESNTMQSLMVAYNSAVGELKTAIEEAIDYAMRHLEVLQSQYTDEKYNEALDQVADTFELTNDNGILKGNVVLAKDLAATRESLEQKLEQSSNTLNDMINSITGDNRNYIIGTSLMDDSQFNLHGGTIMPDSETIEYVHFDSNGISDNLPHIKFHNTNTYNAGDTYTLALDFRSDTVTELDYICLCTDTEHNILHTDMQPQPFNLTSDGQWHRHFMQFTPETDLVNAYVRIGTDFSNSDAGEFDIRRIHMYKGTSETQWQPAPEDNRQFITQLSRDIVRLEGELSNKLGQSDFDLLTGEVNELSTTVSQTVNSIKLKADQSTVDTVAGRVTEAESTLEVHGEGIDSLITKNETIDGTLTTLENKTTETAEGLEQTISRVSSAEDSIETVKADLVTTNKEVSSKLSTAKYNTDQNDVVSRLDAASSERVQLSNRITDKVGLTEFNDHRTQTGTLGDANLSKYIEHAANNGKWLRLAVNPGDRAYGRFIISDKTSSQHGVVEFTASVMYNRIDGAEFTVNNFAKYTAFPFTKARLLTKDTYDDQYLDVLFTPTRDAVNNVDVWLKDNIQVSGWNLQNLEIADIPTGYKSTEYEINETSATGGILRQHSTMIEQNGKDIILKASQKELDSVNKTLSESYSSLLIKANQIESNVTGLSDDLEVTKSSIKQTNDRITTSIGAIDKDIDTVRTLATQTKDSFDLSVIETTNKFSDVDKDIATRVPTDKIISTINASKEGVNISGDKIDITAGSNLKLSIDEARKTGEDAQATADSANSKIDNMEIGGRNLIHNSSFGDGTNHWQINNQSRINENKLRSGNLGFYHLKDFEVTWNDITRLNLNTVTVPFVVDFETPQTERMVFNPEYKEEALAMLDFLRSKSTDLKIIVEPYPLVARGEISETDINPASLDNFFINWREILNELGDIATSYDAYGIYIASNMVKIEHAEGYWKDTVRLLRTHFDGKVIYRKNWWTTASWAPETIEKYTQELNNYLFSYVDIIAISAYFELNEDKITTVKQLEKDLHGTRIFGRGQNIFREVKNFADLWKKPIFFGELGFSNKDKSGSQPWNPTPTNTDNDQAQSNLFEAYGRVFNKESWFIGSSIFQIGNKDDIPYTPRTPAEKVIKNWFPLRKVTLAEDLASPTGSAIHIQSDKKISGVKYSINSEVLSNLNQGKEYTVSFRAKGIGKIALTVGSTLLGEFELKANYETFYASYVHDGAKDIYIHTLIDSFTDAIIHSTQLERGNKVTDWSPAPEEFVDKRKIITEINLSEEEAQISADKIKLTAGSSISLAVDEVKKIADGKVSPDEVIPSINLDKSGAVIAGNKVDLSAKSAIRLAINDSEKKATDYADKAVNDISIGGSNLIPKTDFEEYLNPPSGWSTWGRGSNLNTRIQHSDFMMVQSDNMGSSIGVTSDSMIEDIIEGQTYTLSFIAITSGQVNSAMNYTYMMNDGDGVNYSFPTPKRELIGPVGNMTAYKYTTTRVAPFGGPSHILIGSDSITQGVYGYIYISQPQLEIGNKATAWSRSHRDSVSKERIIAEINLDKSGTKISGNMVDINANRINLNANEDFKLVVGDAKKALTDSSKAQNTANLAVPKNSIISSINASKESIRIEADKLELIGGKSITLRLDDADKAAAEAQSTANTASKKANDVGDELTNLDASGTNMLQHTNFSDLRNINKMGAPWPNNSVSYSRSNDFILVTTSSSSSQIGLRTMDDELYFEPDTQYTLSFKAYSSGYTTGDFNYVYIYRRDGSNEGSFHTTRTKLGEAPQSGFDLYEYKVTFKSTRDHDKPAQMLIADSTTRTGISTWVRIKDIMLQKGNLATPYALHPSEIVEKRNIIPEINLNPQGAKIQGNKIKLVAGDEISLEIADTQKKIINSNVANNNIIPNTDFWNNSSRFYDTHATTATTTQGIIGNPSFGKGWFRMVRSDGALSYLWTHNGGRNRFSVTAGKTYTFSILVAQNYMGNDLNYAYIRRVSDSKQIRMTDHMVSKTRVGDVFGRYVYKYVFTFNIPWDSNNDTVIFFGMNNSAENRAGYYLSEWKLEEGTDATAYTEVFTTKEDLMSQINLDKSGVKIQGSQIDIVGNATFKTTQGYALNGSAAYNRTVAYDNGTRAINPNVMKNWGMTTISGGNIQTDQMRARRIEIERSDARTVGGKRIGVYMNDGKPNSSYDLTRNHWLQGGKAIEWNKQGYELSSSEMKSDTYYSAETIYTVHHARYMTVTIGYNYTGDTASVYALSQIYSFNGGKGNVSSRKFVKNDGDTYWETIRIDLGVPDFSTSLAFYLRFGLSSTAPGNTLKVRINRVHMHG